MLMTEKDVHPGNLRLKTVLKMARKEELFGQRAQAPG